MYIAAACLMDGASQLLFLGEDLTLYKNILISTDGTELSKRAVLHGLALAKSLDARVTALTVMAPYSDASLWKIATHKGPEMYAKHIKSDAEKHIAQVEVAAAESDIDVNTIAATAHHPWEEIIDTAKKLGCDLIIMASHGRGGLNSLLLGSETQKVLAHSSIPVLVHR
mgnify:CR=1 FL=1